MFFFLAHLFISWATDDKVLSVSEFIGYLKELDYRICYKDQRSLWSLPNRVPSNPCTLPPCRCCSVSSSTIVVVPFVVYRRPGTSSIFGPRFSRRVFSPYHSHSLSPSHSELTWGENRTSSISTRYLISTARHYNSRPLCSHTADITLKRILKSDDVIEEYCWRRDHSIEECLCTMRISHLVMCRSFHRWFTHEEWGRSTNSEWITSYLAKLVHLECDTISNLDVIWYRSSQYLFRRTSLEVVIFFCYWTILGMGKKEYEITIKRYFWPSFFSSIEKNILMILSG